jgi:predicted Zn-dependent protease
MYFRGEPPYELYAGEANDTSGVAVVLNSENGKFQIEVLNQGKRAQLDFPDPEMSLADVFAVQHWISRKPMVNDTRRFTSVSLISQQRLDITARGEEIRDAMVGGVETSIYVIKSSIAGLNIETMHTMDAGGMDLIVELGEGMELRKEPREVAVRKDLTTDLYALSMVPVDKSLGDPRQITGLVLDAFGKDAGQLHSTPRQYAQNQKMGVRLATGKFADQTKQLAATASDEDLQSMAGDDAALGARLKNMAVEAIQGASDPAEKVRRLLAFVNGHMQKTPRPEAVALSELLEDPRGDCTEFADLYIALARAMGLPTRAVLGLYYAGDAVQSFGGHMWAETLVNGQWVEVDPSFNLFPIDAAHIRFDVNHFEMLNMDLFFRLRDVARVHESEEVLQKRVAEAKRKGIVAIRHSAEDFYDLAELKVQSGAPPAAIDLYVRALRSDSWNARRRLELMRLYQRTGAAKEACKEARILMDFVEDSAMTAEVVEALEQCGEEFPAKKPSKDASDVIEIFLRPMGDADIHLIRQLAVELTDEMGILFTVEDRPIPMPEPDRTNAYRYVLDIYENIIGNMPQEQREGVNRELGMPAQGATTHEERIHFIGELLRASGQERDNERFLFYRNVADFEAIPQYNIDDAINAMPRKPFRENRVMTGMLAVTDKDLHADDTRYLFGGTFSTKGVVSYFRFTAEYNNTKPDRRRLLDRTLKQALSSANFLLGIKRCTNPNCARAFPINLEEHDRKPTTLCSECRQKLESRIERYKEIQKGN